MNKDKYIKEQVRNLGSFKAFLIFYMIIMGTLGVTAYMMVM